MVFAATYRAIAFSWVHFVFETRLRGYTPQAPSPWSSNIAKHKVLQSGIKSGLDSMAISEDSERLSSS
jgi:hypothetical protein